MKTLGVLLMVFFAVGFIYLDGRIRFRPLGWPYLLFNWQSGWRKIRKTVYVVVIICGVMLATLSIG